jgi:hypothetical protein
MMLWIAILGGAVLAGYALACYFTAENLLATWVDEWRLRRLSLEELDQACARLPRNSGLIVTLTTIPSRLEAIAPTLKSLLRQSVRPAEIRLCLPAWSEREQRAYEIPAWLRSLRCVTLVPCDDAGPATKFLSTLCAVPADQAVVVVDDDRIYHPRLLETFLALAQVHPDRAIAAAGWRVPADLVDHPTTLLARLRRAAYVPVRGNQLRQPRCVDIVQGLHGYVIRPRFFDLGALADFSGAPAAARFVDDVWVSAHCGVPCEVHPLPLAYTDYKPWEHRRRFDATSLGGNVNRAALPAQRGNSIALRHFAARWRHENDGRPTAGGPSS